MAIYLVFLYIEKGYILLPNICLLYFFFVNLQSEKITIGFFRNYGLNVNKW